jgi:hypothetical protein
MRYLASCFSTFLANESVVCSNNFPIDFGRNVVIYFMRNAITLVSLFVSIMVTIHMAVETSFVSFIQQMVPLPMTNDCCCLQQMVRSPMIKDGCFPTKKKCSEESLSFQLSLQHLKYINFPLAFLSKVANLT